MKEPEREREREEAAQPKYGEKNEREIKAKGEQTGLRSRPPELRSTPWLSPNYCPIDTEAQLPNLQS